MGISTFAEIFQFANIPLTRSKGLNFALNAFKSFAYEFQQEWCKDVFSTFYRISFALDHVEKTEIDGVRTPEFRSILKSTYQELCITTNIKHLLFCVTRHQQEAQRLHFFSRITFKLFFRRIQSQFFFIHASHCVTKQPISFTYFERLERIFTLKKKMNFRKNIFERALPFITMCFVLVDLWRDAWFDHAFTFTPSCYFLIFWLHYPSYLSIYVYWHRNVFRRLTLTARNTRKRNSWNIPLASMFHKIVNRSWNVGFHGCFRRSVEFFH